MTCKECKPHTHAVKDGRVVLATELCAKHALTDRLAEAARAGKLFITYARYELKDGKATIGDQFPRKDDADEYIAKIDTVLAEYDAKNQEKP